METITTLLSEWAIYIPLGIIGIWRWGVWLLKKIASLFYRPENGEIDGSMTVVTPVYNEDPKIFKKALESWKKNDVQEIIAVIDYTDEVNIGIFEDFGKTFSGAVLVVTEVPGKRPALANGIRRASCDFIALVDSDTVWSDNIKKKMLAPFKNEKVGGVGPRQDILNDNTLARKIFKIQLDDRYLTEFKFLGATSRVVTCLSGRTAVYRKKAIENLTHDLENETFWGQKAISGDDKTLTYLMESKGWEARYVANAKVYTPGAPNLGFLMKQRVRWSRNSWRADIRTILSRWTWSHPVIVLYILDRFVQPFTLLLGPIYLAFALSRGDFFFAGILILWWHVSRAIKIFPHLKERPLDIFILPVYIVLNYVNGLIKLYALITFHRQGWITRWDKSRLNAARFFDHVFSYGSTIAVLFLLSATVFYSRLDFSSKRIVDYSNENRAAAFFLLGGKEIELTKFMKRQTLLRGIISNEEAVRRYDEAKTLNSAAKLASYQIKSEESLNTFRRKYNLSPLVKIVDGNNPSLQIFSAFAGRKVSVAPQDLRNEIKPNQFVSLRFPVVVYDRAANVLSVRGEGSVVNLSQIQARISRIYGTSLLEKTNDKEWILRANLDIGENVTLILDGGEVSWLKLKSDINGFVWLKTEDGSILINKTKITSWNETNGAPDEQYEDGRSFVLAKDNARMDVIDSEIAYLGHRGLPTLGGPFGGSYGLSWKLSNNTVGTKLIAGVVRRNKIHHNYFGVYTFGSSGMHISDNEVYQNVNYGIDPHDDSNFMLIENNDVHDNGNHGIITSKRCVFNIIRNNKSYRNKLHGIMLHENSNNNMVYDNLVYGNKDGISIFNSHGNIIENNSISENTDGVRLNQNSSGNVFANNEIVLNERGIYIYNESRDNTFYGNRVINNDIGYRIKTGQANNFAQQPREGDNRINVKY